MAVVDALYAGYGGDPDQNAIYAQGNAYLEKSFPLLDYTLATSIVEGAA